MSKNSSTAEILNSLPKVPTHTPLSPEQEALRYVGEKISSIAERDSDLSERMRVIFRDRSLPSDRFQKERFSSEIPSGVVEQLRKIKKKHAARDDASIAEFKRIHSEASGVENKAVQDLILRSLAGVIGYLENTKRIIAEQGVDSRGNILARISRAFRKSPVQSASASSSSSSAAKSSNSTQSAPQPDEYEGLDELLDSSPSGLPDYLKGSEYDLPVYLEGTSHDKRPNQRGGKPGSNAQPSSALPVDANKPKSR